MKKRRNYILVFYMNIDAQMTSGNISHLNKDIKKQNISRLSFIILGANFGV